MQVGFEASSIRRHISGVGHYTASLLKALHTDFPDQRLLVLSHLSQQWIRGANIIPTQKRSFPIKEIWMQLWLPRILTRYKPDICHFTNNIAPLNITVPYAVTVHDLSLIKHPEWHPRSRRIWMRRIMRPSIVRASGIICDSENTRKDLSEWIELDPAKVWVIPLAARDGFFVPRARREKEIVRSRYGLHRPFLLYVGNIEPRKNLARLLRVFRKLNPPGVDLVLAGRRAWLSEEILREAEHSRNRERVHLLDYVIEEDLPALYQSSLAFVYPSLMEGFGLPVLEAMASGTPVLVSDVQPLSSLVDDSTGWLIPPESEDAWQSALREAIEDPAKRTAVASRAKQKAAQYSWARVARETVRCYESILAQMNH